MPGAVACSHERKASKSEEAGKVWTGKSDGMGFGGMFVEERKAIR